MVKSMYSQPHRFYPLYLPIQVNACKSCNYMYICIYIVLTEVCFPGHRLHVSDRLLEHSDEVAPVGGVARHGGVSGRSSQTRRSRQRGGTVAHRSEVPPAPEAVSRDVR